MATNPSKAVWTAHNQLKNWAVSTNSIAQRFKLKTLSFDETTTTIITTDSASAHADSNTPISIFGLIYPSTEPYRQRGLNVEMQLPNTYPFEPLAVYMRTRIRHPNIEKDGKICTPLLDPARGWKKDVTLCKVVETVINLMEKPDDGYPVDAEMASLHQSNIDEYNRKITEMVICYGETRS